MFRITRFLVGGAIGDGDDVLRLIEAAITDGAYLEDEERGQGLVSMKFSIHDRIEQGKCLVFIKDGDRDAAIVALERVCGELRLETLRLTTSGGDEEVAFIRRIDREGREISASAVQDGNNLQPALTLAELRQIRATTPGDRNGEWFRCRLFEIEALDTDIHPMPALTYKAPAPSPSLSDPQP